MPAIRLARRLRHVNSTRRSPSPRSPPSIGPGLAKAALAGKVDGKLVDTSLSRSTAMPTLAIVTDKDPEGLEVLRHSTAHLLAYAVKELFPDAQVTIGPVIEDGFYYDFSYKRPFTPEDLAAIEKQDGRAREEGRAGRAQADAARRGGRVLQGAWASTTRPRSSRRFRPNEDDLALRRRRVHRPVPRPARAVDRQAQGVQADEGRRRVLARRLEERDAAADLRHRLGEEGRPRRLPAHARGGREARPPQARPRSSTSSTCRTRRRAWCSGIRRAGRSGSRSSSTCAASTRTTATRRCAARRSSTARCGSSPATGRTTRRTCSRPSRRSATTRSSR